MRKLLILENNKREENNEHRVLIENIRNSLEKEGIILCGVEVSDKIDSPHYGTPGKDLIYRGHTIEADQEWDICLRTVYVPPEQGLCFFHHKLVAVVENYKPDCILTHLGLYGRGERFYDYPVIKDLLPYTQKDIRLAVYTGSSDDSDSFIVDTDGRVKFCYNSGRDINTQIQIIKRQLQEQ